MGARRLVFAPVAVFLVLVAVVIVARVRGWEKARVPSPDGRYVAVVKTHWSPDPPAESLWLGGSGERLERLETLGEDQDWCSEIVWAEGSGAVAFVVTGTRALVVEPEARDRRRVIPLVAEDDYPSSREARTVRFSEKGESLVFRDCARGGSDCRDEQVGIGG